jgi:inosose dehydratase
VRVACHTITWGEPNLDLALAEIAELGFGAFETFASVVDRYDGKEADFQDLLDRTGMRLISLYGGGDMHLADSHDAIVAWNLRIAAFLARFGADRMVLGPSRRTDAGPTADELELLATTANEIGAKVRELGVTACLHPHVFTVVESAEEIAFVVDRLEPASVAIAADTAHFAKGNSQTEGAETALFQQYADRIAYVHLKDWDPSLPPDLDSDSHTPVIRDFVELGQGKVQLKPCLDVLRQRDYNGWLTIELDYTKRTPKEAVAISLDYLQRELGLHPWHA